MIPCGVNQGELGVVVQQPGPDFFGVASVTGEDQGLEGCDPHQHAVGECLFGGDERG